MPEHKSFHDSNICFGLRQKMSARLDQPFFSPKVQFTEFIADLYKLGIASFFLNI